MTVHFVTGNENKFQEARGIASEHGMELKHTDLDYTEIQADTLEEIAKPSAEEAFESVGEACFVEDAGLFTESLNGFPGPYSSYVYEKIGNQGVLRLMKGRENRNAEFRSVVCYVESGSEFELFVGKIKGKITREIRGSRGFGYDPIFKPEGGKGKTFAEMTIKRKNALSHRASSIEKFVKWYVKNKKAGD